MSPANGCATRRRQRGVAALEFALVCVLFLIVLFGLVSYGGLFLAQQALARAAEEGARAALASSLSGSASVKDDVCAVVSRAVEGLNRHRASLGIGPVSCPDSVAPRPCPYAADLQCISLVVTYTDYRNYPLVPDVVPLGRWLQSLFGVEAAWMPQDLSAAATVQLGRAGT